MSIDARGGDFRRDEVPAVRMEETVQASVMPSEDRIAESEERLNSATESIKAEFRLVAEAIRALESVKPSEALLSRAARIGDRIGALAEISPELASHPEVRRDFDGAVLYVANSFIRTLGKKFAESDSPKAWVQGYAELRGKIENSLRSLGPVRE